MRSARRLDSVIHLSTGGARRGVRAGGRPQPRSLPEERGRARTRVRRPLASLGTDEPEMLTGQKRSHPNWMDEYTLPTRSHMITSWMVKDDPRRLAAVAEGRTGQLELHFPAPRTTAAGTQQACTSVLPVPEVSDTSAGVAPVFRPADGVADGWLTEPALCRLQTAAAAHRFLHEIIDDDDLGQLWSDLADVPDCSMGPASHNMEISELQEQLQTARSRLAALEEQLQTARSRNAALEESAQTAQESAQTLRSRNAALEQELTRARIEPNRSRSLSDIIAHLT